MKNLFRAEPVLVLLGGLAGVVDVVLVALVAVGAIDWTTSQAGAVVAAVAAVSGLLTAVVRAAVFSPATVDRIRAEAPVFRSAEEAAAFRRQLRAGRRR